MNEKTVGAREGGGLPTASNNLSFHRRHQLHAIHARHDDIENHQVRLALLNHLERSYDHERMSRLAPGHLDRTRRASHKGEVIKIVQKVISNVVDELLEVVWIDTELG